VSDPEIVTEIESHEPPGSVYPREELTGVVSVLGSMQSLDLMSVYCRPRDVQTIGDVEK
jgi:hypothetical protein